MKLLGVGISGIGWCAAEHIKAFGRNPHARIVLLHGRDEERARKKLAGYGADVSGARFTKRYEDLLESDDVDIVSITTPNHLHADQAVAAARAGKHLVIEKPTALNVRDLARIRDAVRRARVRTIVSFELHYNPYLRFVHWLRASGRLGRIRFARVQYLSRVTDWYAGWEWVRKRKTGGSHLLAAGCH
ncbi:MAG TPA: Gfo/Idh/MocA family oxidoreductase, partial [Vicinamibacteria bacterium]|nr:Gfo/Idh/MocA family oxidoreductase [Vicinamibacteria bacterium]